MSIEFKMRKRTISVLFLISILASSCSPQCHQWKLAVIKADCPPARYIRVYLPACNTFNGMETVLMSHNGSIRLYLNVFTLLFPYDDETDQEHTSVFIAIGEEKYCFIADRLQGGQCLALPDEATELIVNSLLENQCVKISTGRYQTTLICDNFATAYYRL